MERQPECTSSDGDHLSLKHGKRLFQGAVVGTGERERDTDGTVRQESTCEPRPADVQVISITASRTFPLPEPVLLPKGDNVNEVGGVQGCSNRNKINTFIA